MASLTAKQRRFVDEYMVDSNATQAAVRAGYSKKTAKQTGTENLSKPVIRSEIERRQAELSESTGVTAERVIKEVARLALFDPRRLFDADGKPLPIQQLDDDTAAAIGGLKVVTKGNAELGFAEILDYKVTDKGQALDKLMKHLGLYEKDNKQKDTGLADALTKAIARVKDSGR